MRRLPAFAACALLALASGAAAQHPVLGGPEPRPLHAQLEGADAVAIATVETVGVGRIGLVEAQGVLGSVPAAFELKRAPAEPPPLLEGDRALLLLRGARTPYLLASEPLEVIARLDPGTAPDWTAALRRLRAAGSDGEQLGRVYAGWLAGAPRMQREGAIGLADPACPATLLTGEVAERLAALAASGEEPTLRRAAARAAVRSAAGRARLLALMPGDDPLVLSTAFRAAADDALPALLRALRHESAEIRGAALRESIAFRSDREVQARVVRIASEDPDRQLRELARRVMKTPLARDPR